MFKLVISGDETGCATREETLGSEWSGGGLGEVNSEELLKVF